MLHSIYDWSLPVTLTMTQIYWGLGTFFFILMFHDTILLSWFPNALVKWLGLPIGVAWFMSQKTFDGKKPHKFLFSVVWYYANKRKRFSGKPINLRKKTMDISYTVCERSVAYVD